MNKLKLSIILALGFLTLSVGVIDAQSPVRSISPVLTGEDSATVSAEATESAATATPQPTETPRPDLTQKSEESVEPLKKILQDQILGPILPYNPLKYAIRGAVDAGVPPNTLVLLLLLPGVAALIASARHLVGLRGFGIFLPAALSVVFIAIGPLLGIGLFLIIVVVSTLVRMMLRKIKIKLQYLPRTALMLHFVVLGILSTLFLAPYIGITDFSNVSIFPVLFLVLLAEDFTRVQLGKSVRVAINLSTETLILALISFTFLNLRFMQQAVLLQPEIWIISVAVIDILLGKFIGLRLMEYWRFRKLIKG